MVKIEDFYRKENNVHHLGNVYAFIGLDCHGTSHLYIVGSASTIMELSDINHEEYAGFVTVEDFADENNETILKIYETFDSFCVKLEGSI